MNLIDALRDINTVVYYIKNSSLDDIVFEMVSRFNLDINYLLKTPMGGYNKDKTSGTYFYCLKDLKDNINEYVELYYYLEDNMSRLTLLNIIRYRLTTDVSFLRQVYAGVDNQYFDKSIVNCYKDEVFVDCGGYIGDTVIKYIEKYKNYKSIYVYEPEKDNYNNLYNNTKHLDNIITINKGVSKSKDRVYYRVDGGASYISNIPTDTFIDTVSLDDDINEKVTFIKMDIEGEEINAILGGKNHIKNNSPKLAVAVYHIVSDLWEIPKLIKSINNNYKFYLRQYREDVAWETIIYAIPKNKF